MNPGLDRTRVLVRKIFQVHTRFRHDLFSLAYDHPYNTIGSSSRKMFLTEG